MLGTRRHMVKNEDGNVSKCGCRPIIRDWRDTSQRCQSSFDQVVTVVIKESTSRCSSCIYYVMKTGVQQVHTLLLFFEAGIINMIELVFGLVV